MNIPPVPPDPPIPINPRLEVKDYHTNDNIEKIVREILAIIRMDKTKEG